MMPEKRLIDANALVDKVRLDWGLTHQSQLISATTKLAAADAMCKLLGEVAKCQTIDAVEVVRCRDCRNSQKLKTCADQVYCLVWKSNPRTDGYCYLGAKMDGGEPHEENPHTL